MLDRKVREIADRNEMVFHSLLDFIDTFYFLSFHDFLSQLIGVLDVVNGKMRETNVRSLYVIRRI